MNRKVETRELNSSLFLGLLMLPFFQPVGLFYFFPALNQVFNTWEIVSFIIVVGLFLMERKASKMFLAIIAYEAVLFVSTLAGGSNNYWRLAVSCGEVVSLCMLIEIAVRHNPKVLIRSMLCVLGIECMVNLFTVILFPDGMYYASGYSWNNWFLGYDNKHQLFIFPLLCIFLIFTTHKQMSATAEFAGIVLFSASVYMTWSATAVVGFTVFILLIVLLEFRFQLGIVEVKKGFMINLAAFLAIVIFRVQNLFEFLIVDILHKDLTFSKRTLTWDRAIEYFKDNMLIGIGQYSREANKQMIGLAHPHNLYLRVLYETGIVGAVCFIAIILILAKKMKEYQKNRYGYILSVTIFCFFLIFQTEAPDYMTTFFGITMLGYHIEDLTAGMVPEHRRQVRWLYPNLRIRMRRRNMYVS